MRTISGIGISPGIALGELYCYEKQVFSVEYRSGLNPSEEMARLETALAAAREELQAILDNASSRLKKEDADIFSAHLLILEDPALLDNVKTRLEEQGCNSEWAWNEAISYYSQMIAGLGDEYMAARSADILDVGQRVLRRLAGRAAASQALEKPVIIVAEELAPSDTVTFDSTRVLAFCTAKGGPTSHIAILSKALGIPAVTALGPWMGELAAGKYAIVDGETGELILEPDETTCKEYESRSKAYAARMSQAMQTALAPAITKDGERVEVVANIGSAEAAPGALEFGAEGVGLLRTEFLFLDREDAPDEEEQVEVYHQILEVFGQRPVVIRTLDIGGDKPAPYLPMPAEMNPFLGVRGARLGLKYPQVLRMQLRALLRAGLGHNLKIMFPMISTLAEIQAVRSQVQQAQAELETGDLPYSKTAEIGIMVEVPSAAVMADVFAPHVDFFSIGTNDLSQYTLAADRTNPDMAYLADAMDPAVLRLIGGVTRAAHAQGKWVGLCGELAGEPLAAPVLLGLGVDEFSMNPRAIPLVKEALHRFTVPKAKEIAARTLDLSTASEVRAYLKTL